MNTKTIAPPDLGKLNELAKVHALSYASPHHFTMSVNGLRNLVAAIAALEAEPQGWMPIETAPKDGTRILLSNGETVAEGEWLHAEPYVKEIRDMDGRYVDQEENDGHDDWVDCIGGMLPPPTHWMPLPQAPETKP